MISNFAYLAARLSLRASASFGGRPAKSAGCACFCSTFRFFSTASLSVAVFYICAQRELHPRTWMKEILLLPALIALGVGLSINNARAVLEAVFNHPFEFTRTPKYGIENKSTDLAIMPLHAAQISSCRSSKSVSRFTFSYIVWYAVAHEQYFTLPFLVMFQCGFLYVALSSLAQWWPRINFPRAREVAFPA